MDLLIDLRMLGVVGVGREGRGGENSVAGGDPRLAAIPGSVVLGLGPLLVAGVT